MYLSMDQQTLLELIRNIEKTEAFDTLITGVLAAAFGAFFGAWGAQAVIARNQKRQAITEELNAINGAIGMSFFICNRFLALKDQHVKRLHDEYIRSREAARQAKEVAQNEASSKPQILEFVMDLQTITPIKLPTERLEKFVFEKISVRGRAPIAAVDLVGAIDGLQQSITLRNELILEYRTDQRASHTERAMRYFGFRNEQGVVDDRYASTVDAIYAQTDDCIFFARTLADDLYTYGVKLRKKSAWKDRWRIPKLTQLDWSKAEENSLMPPPQQYKDWLAAFEEHPGTIKRILGKFGFQPQRKEKAPSV